MLKLTFDFDFYDFFFGLLNPSENTSVFRNSITHTICFLAVIKASGDVNLQREI